ncbi:MAG: dipeptidase PepE [Planctomycetota bacterium]
MKRLLLISNSTQHGSGYLEHCADTIKAFLGDVRRVLFVPYALADLDGYAATARQAYEALGFGLDAIHEAEDPVAAVAAAEALFIGGGNTFRLLNLLYEHQLIEPIRQRVAAGMPYIGTSAGSNVACLSIQTTNDMPIVYPPSFDALALLPVNLNPHFIDPDAGSTHMGESRETRIREFHEMNAAPVVGIREGAMLRVEGTKMTLLGRDGAVLFRRGQPRVDYETGVDLSFLLH